MSAPTTLDKALSGADGKQWQAAIDAQLALLDDRKVWEWVACAPAQAKVIPSTWRFTSDSDSEGNAVDMRAEVVAVGPRSESTDDNVDRVPLVIFRSLRVMLAIAATESQQLCHIQIPNAHLGHDLEEPVYLAPPPGTKAAGVYRLRKPIPGLPGTRAIALERIADGLEDAGFEPIDSDTAVYVRNKEAKNPTVALTHGNDILLMGPTTLEINDVLIDLGFSHGPHAVGNLGHPRSFLNVTIESHHPTRQLWLSQPALLRDLCEQFPEVDALPDVYAAPDEDHAYDSLTPERYTALIRALIYISLTTRPDIALWVSALAQEAHDGGSPSHHDRASALTLLAHLRKMRTASLSFGGRHDEAPRWFPESPLAAYSHAAALVGNECWQWGYVVHLLGSTVAWDSRRCTAAKHIHHAELVGQHEALGQASAISLLLTQLGYWRFTPAVLPIRACSTPEGPESDELPDEAGDGMAAGAGNCTKRTPAEVDACGAAISALIQSRRVLFLSPEPYCIGSTSPTIQYAEYMARLVDKARDLDGEQYRYWVMQLGVVEPRPAGVNLKRVLETGGMRVDYYTDSVMGDDDHRNSNIFLQPA